jgi:hypothetical protein
VTSTRSELLATVERSPQATASHDRPGWIGLFTADGRVEDPVGSRPHVGHEEIGRFYDTFIAPRQITFHRDLDIVEDATVVRDLTLEVVLGSGLTMHIPAVLRYDLREEDGQLKVELLRAYWELPTMVLQMFRQGVKSVPASLQLGAGLLRHQRISGTMGFLSGMRRAGRREKRRVEEYLAAEFRGATWSKLIAAGDTVAASIVTPTDRGVVFCEIDRAAGTIGRARYFGG